MNYLTRCVFFNAFALGRYAKVIVSGGIVRNVANNRYPVIYVNAPFNKYLNVIVCGTGKVEAIEKGIAIASEGCVEVSDQAQVSAASDVAIQITSFLEESTVKISGTSKVMAAGAYTINFEKTGSVEVADYAQVINSGTGICVLADTVKVKDHAQIIAKNGVCAIKADSEVVITGGTVFAPNSNMSAIVNCSNFTGVTGTGLLLAWDKGAGNTAYEKFSTDDIFKQPESATAYWDVKDSEYGIYYANSENTGFIPLEVTVVLSTIGPVSSNLTIYPNPTTGELTIDNGQLRIDNVEVFDVYGRKLSQISNSISQIPILINISHLPAGIYFVKIHTESGEEIRKVVKE